MSRQDSPAAEPTTGEGPAVAAPETARATPSAAAHEPLTLSVHLASASPPGALFNDPLAYGGGAPPVLRPSPQSTLLLRVR